MTKVKIDAGYYPSEVKVFDYALMGGSLIPIEYRDKILRKNK